MKKPASSPLTIEEIRARHMTGRNKCSLEEFVRTKLTKADAKVLTEALQDRKLQVTAIFRSLEARGFKRGELVIRRHRERLCLDCRGSWLTGGSV